MQIQQRELSVRQRAVSFLLAILMILMGIPSSLTSTLADGPMGGGLSGYNSGRNNVLTNVSVSFYDSKFHAIAEADSGELFYLSVQLAGNNVNEPFGKDNFRLEISDNNLLLPNFAGNGFKDGAVYNGFTLHYDEATGKRYLDYDIRNGDTKMIRLQAKFANGITPDGLKETVKLIQTSSGKTISNTITANSNLAWNQNKSQDKNMLSGDALKTRTTVNYTLSASPNNSNKSKGAWWASGLHFIDELKIPEGSGIVAEYDLEKALKATGFTYKIISATSPFEFYLYSKDKSKDMDSVNILLPVTYKYADNVDTDKVEGSVTVINDLNVSVKGIGEGVTEDGEEDDNEKYYHPVGNSNVSLVVNEPTKKQAKFSITKDSETKSLDYDKADLWDEAKTKGDEKTSKEIEYTIIVENTGEAEGDITLVENPAKGITITGVESTNNNVVFNSSDNTITVGKLKENESVKISVKATITTSSGGTFTNYVYEDGNKGNGDSHDITVDKKEPNISSYKTGWVGSSDTVTDITSYQENDDICYSIVIENTGTLKKDVLVSDDLSTVSKSNGVTWNEDVSIVTINEQGTEVNSTEKLADNEYSKTFTVEPKQKITITFSGKVNQNCTDTKLENTAKVDGKDKTATLKKATPSFNVTKTINSPSDSNLDNSKTDENQRVEYEVVIENTGVLVLDTSKIVIDETPDNGITLDTVSVNLEKTVLTGKDEVTSNDVGAEWVDSTKKAIKLTNLDSLKKGDKVVLTVTADVRVDGNTKKYTNTVGVRYGDVSKESNPPAILYAKDPPKNWDVKKEIISVEGEDVDEDTTIAKDDVIAYQVTITNNDDSTIKNLQLYDYGAMLYFRQTETGTDETVLKAPYYNPHIVSSTQEDINNNKDNFVISNVAAVSSGWSQINLVIENLNLKKGENVVIQYTATAGGNTNNDVKWTTNLTGIKNGNGNTSYKADQFSDGNVYNYVAAAEATPKTGNDGQNNGWEEKPENGYNKEDIVYLPVNTGATTQLNLTKNNVGNSTLDLTDMTEQDIKNAEFWYNLEATGSGNDYENYQLIITDTFPDGMELVKNSVKVWYTGNKWDNYDKEIEVENPDINDKETGKLKISFNSKIKFSGNAGENYQDNIKVKYALKFTDEKAKELAELISTAETGAIRFKNEAILTVVEGGKKGKDRPTSPTSAIVSVTKVPPAPGFAKKAIASFAGTNMQEDGVQFSRVENGYITAGDSLIWDLVVYNGDGKSNCADLKLENATITDIIPGVYEYKKIISKGVYKLQKFETEDGINYDYSRGIDGTETASDVKALFTALEPGNSTVSIGEYQNGMITLNGTLSANECVVIRVLTTIKDGQETEGVITNKGYLTTDKEYSQNAVVAGEPKGKEIWNYANYNIVGLTTESWKTINYKNEGHTGDPHTDPKTDTGYSREATHNYVQGMQGEKVTYELHIKNTSPQNLESWTIIDRLPYVGDVGLVSGFERDSAFGVMMGEISKITVGGEELAKSDYEVSYSTDKTTVLTEYSKDWLRGTSGEMQWSSKQTDSTIDFRVAFVKNENTIVEPGEEIVITFTGYVPAYVANTGEDNIAWNSFAYAYQCPSIFGDDYVMVAEPAKVGVWVEQPDNTITITINKTSDTAGTFYFALFDTADATGNRLSDVISITIPAGINFYESRIG